MFFPEKIDTETLLQRQRELGSKLPVFCVESTGSTNSDVAVMLTQGSVRRDFAVVANAQSAGRGRIPGRRWESLPGNIFLSCGFFPPNIPPSRLANFTLWMGASVAKKLREKFELPVVVKWPNDIWCRGKKMAGMLTEAHTDAGRIRGIVFGIGLNVNLDAETLPKNEELRATSLRAELGGEKLDINLVCAELLLAIENAYADFIAGTHGEKLAAIWRGLDCLDGQRVIAVYGTEKITGTACGIDDGGNLLIRTDTGTIHAFSAGDITLEKFRDVRR